MPLPAWFDSGPVDPRTPAVGLLDAGLRSGVGVFETLRAHGTATLAADRHLARLVEGAERLGITVAAERVADALQRTLAAPRDVHQVVARITVTAGPVAEAVWPPAPVGPASLSITLHPAPILPLPPLTAASVPATRWPADVKSTSYLPSVMAQRAARHAGADIAMLVDGDELLESAEGNVLAVLEGALVTPPADGRLLAGVTRGLVIEEAQRLNVTVRTVPLHASDVVESEALLVTSAVSGIRTVLSLDGRLVAGHGADGVLHPLVVELRDALERRRG